MKTKARFVVRSAEAKRRYATPRMRAARTASLYAARQRVIAARSTWYRFRTRPRQIRQPWRERIMSLLMSRLKK